MAEISNRTESDCVRVYSLRGRWCRSESQVQMQRLINTKSVWLKRHVNQTYLFGLTESFLDKVLDHGDIDSINATVHGINVQWSGLKVTEGDELYHCQYVNVYGTESFQFPDSTRIIEINKDNVLLGKQLNRLSTCSKAIESIHIGKIIVDNLDVIKEFKLL